MAPYLARGRLWPTTSTNWGSPRAATTSTGHRYPPARSSRAERPTHVLNCRAARDRYHRESPGACRRSRLRLAAISGGDGDGWPMRRPRRAGPGCAGGDGLTRPRPWPPRWRRRRPVWG